LIAGLIAVIAGTFVCGIFGCGSDPGSLQSIESQPFEKRLALVDSTTDPAKIIRYRYLIENLSEHTSTPQKEVYELTLWTKDYLERQYGKRSNCIDIMEDLNTASASGSACNYKDLTAIYVVSKGK